MMKIKKGFLKKIGCFLISASVILSGWTFFGGLTSDAGLNDDGDAFSFENGESVSASAYAGNSTITSVDDDGNGATIGDSAFSNCSALTNVNIMGTASVGTQAFLGCSSLNQVYLGSVSTISSDSFRDCSSLTSFTIGSSGTYWTYNNALYKDTELIFVPAGITTLTVSSSCTSIADDAFYGSRVSELTFEKASNITSFGTQSNWPLFSNSSYTLTVKASDGADTAVEDYFDGYVIDYGDTRCILLFDNADTGDSDDTIDITVVEEFYDSDGNIESDKGTSTTTTYTVGATITAATYDGYGLTSGNSPYTVTGTETAAITFTYKAGATDSYNVTVIEEFYDTSNTIESSKTTTTTNTYESGATITAATYDGYTLSSGNSPYTVTGADTVTFTYAATSSSDSNNSGSTTDSTTTKTYTVTVYDVFYQADGTTKIETKTRTTDTYTAGTTYSYEAKTYSGYTYFDGEYQSGTVNTNRTATFKYKKTTTSSASSGKATEGIYKITEGASQTVAQTGGPVRIVCNGPMEKLTNVMVDGVDIPQGNYTLETGSVILTMTYNYIKSLSVGTHVVRFQYTDGYGETNLTITGKTTTTVTYTVASDGTVSQGRTQDTTPKTADGFDNRYLLCIAIFMLGAAVLLFSRQQRNLEILAARSREEY
ncbi:MAG: leucine-rich repeat domain-containing protein [Pseudobutyrivibrio sp.]|nr:leucine-rich repeat domain-containing protein [Pseudobutyrivibrio sp.]